MLKNSDFLKFNLNFLVCLNFSLAKILLGICPKSEAHLSEVLFEFYTKNQTTNDK